MNTKTTVEQELLAATGQKAQGKKESDQDYLVRISSAVSDLPDEDYEKLTEPAKAWFTQAADALNEEPPAPENIQPFSSFDEAEKEMQEGDAAGSEEESEPAAEEEPPKPKAKKKAAPVITKGKVMEPDKGKKAKAEAKAVNTGTAVANPKDKKKEKNQTKGKRENSVADTIRVLLCENPETTKEEIAQALKAKKMAADPVRLTYIYSTTLRVIQILKEQKKLK